MAMFRCYFLNSRDHILSAKELDADTLGEAVETARALMLRTDFAVAVELWEGNKLVYPPLSSSPTDDLLTAR